MKDMEGSRINYKKIEIGKELGKGAFGVIYEGKLEKESVAIKSLLLPSGAMSLSFGTEEESSGSFDTATNSSTNTNGEISLEEAKEILNVFDEFRREVFMMQYVECD
jgi:hypothetical protein